MQSGGIQMHGQIKRSGEVTVNRYSLVYKKMHDRGQHQDSAKLGICAVRRGCQALMIEHTDGKLQKGGIRALPATSDKLLFCQLAHMAVIFCLI
jgi:hypothetical protein